MSLTFGTLAGTLELDDKPFDQGLQKAGGKFGGLVKAAGVAAVGIAGALAGGAVASVLAFSGFQDSMNEVFTLLPGISDKAMGDMTGQVKDFAKEFGVLPDKVVPALYQSISAGVPKDNVFAFLETAQKAAKGGVTDLTTAVDGISSVVNAYGSDVVDATKASDLMFTAVRLGKTDFSQLSSSLFNVIPTAAALGVQFGDVTAALASMTAQGVPTSVATTQLRQMFVELSKAGSDTSNTFQEATNKTFKQFVAEGGNVQEALQAMERYADKAGIGISDMFGSVEAGSAALALTGRGTAKFSDALSGMQESAGATDKAYEQMQTGMSASFDRIKATASVVLLEIGSRLAPLVATGAEKMLAGFETISEWWGRNGPAIMSAAGTLAAGIAAAAEVIIGVVSTIIENWSQLEPFVIGIAAVVAAVMLPHWLALAAAATASAAKQAVAWMVTHAAAIAAAAVHSAQVVAMIAKWAFFGAQSLIHAAKVAAAWLIAMGPIALVAAAVVGIVALIVLNWGTITRVTGELAGKVVGFFSGIISWLQSNWPLVLAILTGPFGLAVLAISTHWDTIVGVITGMPGRIASAARGMFDGIKNAFRSAINFIIDAWNGLEFKIPGFDPPGPGPKFGGFTIGVPNIPRLHSGGDILSSFPSAPGLASDERLIVGQVGERVLSRGQAGGATVTNRVVVPLSSLRPGDLIDGRDLVEKLVSFTRANGPIQLDVA